MRKYITKERAADLLSCTVRRVEILAESGQLAKNTATGQNYKLLSDSVLNFRKEHSCDVEARQAMKEERKAYKRHCTAESVPEDLDFYEQMKSALNSGGTGFKEFFIRLIDSTTGKDNEREIMRQFFSSGMSLKYVDAPEYTRERVRQIINKGFKRLSDGLVSYSELEEKNKIYQERIEHLEEQVARLSGENTFLRDALKIPDSETDSCNEPLVMRVTDLSLSVRAKHCLKNLDIRTVGELILRTKSDLMKTPNFGRKTLKEIVDELNELGLELRN